MKCLLLICAALGLASCNDRYEPSGKSLFHRLGKVEILGKTSVGGQNFTMNPSAIFTDLGGNFGWSEGPVWINDDTHKAGGYLLFTDVPGNTIHRYDPYSDTHINYYGEPDQEGHSIWLKPSGSDPVADYTSSSGANGLLTYGVGKILVPDHGNRALYSLDLATKAKTLLADSYEGKRLNSPNDVVVHDNGIIYFTDPPYGLKNQDESAAKELDFNGVFALYPDGTLKVLDKTLTRPNGIALSPDQRTLYVANSDPKDARYLTYSVDDLGNVSDRQNLLDVTDMLAGIGYGNPDGMAVASDGTIFATGPGGVLVLSPRGVQLAHIRTFNKPCANATFGSPKGNYLFMTCQDRLAVVHTRRKGIGF